MPPELVLVLKITTAMIELLGAGVLVSGFLFSLWRYLRHYRHLPKPDLIREYKSGLGRTVLIGLEILVAATIVKTVTVKPTLHSIGLLAGVIAVRTIIGWTMMLEMYGHWPWQKNYGNTAKEQITSPE